MEEVIVGETLDGHPSVETVNQHLLEKLDKLILASDDPEEIRNLTESLAKYNTSIKNNDIFEKESDEERRQREISENIKAAIHGEDT